MKIKTLLISAITAFLIVLLSTLTVVAYEYEHKGLAQVPSAVYVSTAFSAKAQARCQDAMTTWNQTCFAYSCLTYGGTTTLSSFAVEDGQNTITFTQDLEAYLGETFFTKKKYTFLWLDWYVVEFDININSCKDWFTEEIAHAITLNTYAGYFDMETTVLHELGHALGLAHTDQEFYNGYRVVMYPSCPTQTTVRDLSEDDRLGIVNLY